MGSHLIGFSFLNIEIRYKRGRGIGHAVVCRGWATLATYHLGSLLCSPSLSALADPSSMCSHSPPPLLHSCYLLYCWQKQLEGFSEFNPCQLLIQGHNNHGLTATGDIRLMKKPAFFVKRHLQLFNVVPHYIQVKVV